MSISLLSLLLFTSASVVPCEAFLGKIFNQKRRQVCVWNNRSPRLQTNLIDLISSSFFALFSPANFTIKFSVLIVQSDCYKIGSYSVLPFEIF